MLIALASQPAGNEVLTQLNNAAFAIPAAIVAAHVSATTDFSALIAGDLVVHVPATAGNAAFFTVATAGTLPAAAVVGDLYIVLRSAAKAVQSTTKL
jgi:hypothetical protein